MSPSFSSWQGFGQATQGAVWWQAISGTLDSIPLLVGPRHRERVIGKLVQTSVKATNRSLTTESILSSNS